MMLDGHMTEAITTLITGDLDRSVSAITLTANDRYVAPAVVLIASLEGRVPAGLEIVVQDTGLGSEARSLIERQAAKISCPLRFVRVGIEQFQKAKLLLHWISP